jgi:allophanate hydrolase subunit 2
MYFEVLRAGINTTIQDDGRKNLYHIGVTSSGAIDKKNYKLSNIILKNEINNPAIEFAFQGPHLKMKNGRCFICITGSVDFQLIRNNGLVEKGYGYKIYNLEEEDEIDIRSTKSSVYGYLNVKNGFNFEKVWGSYSINTKANIGPNEGKKFSNNQKIYLNRIFR